VAEIPSLAWRQRNGAFVVGDCRPGLAIVGPGICAVQPNQKLHIGSPVLHDFDGLMGGCGRTFWL